MKQDPPEPGRWNNCLLTHCHKSITDTVDSKDCKEVSLRGRRSKGKGKGIRARDRARPRAQIPLLTPATQATKRLDPPLDYEQSLFFLSVEQNARHAFLPLLSWVTCDSVLFWNYT